MQKSHDEQGDIKERKHRKKRRRRRSSRHSLGRRDSTKNTRGKDKRERRKSSLSKRKLSQKLNTKRFEKSQQTYHLNKTVQIWKLRWKNRYWRQKWKSLWGKNKWKPSMRKRWNMDKKWRRKWMKKILKNWWDKKWRRKWSKRWIDNRWLARWNRKRLMRKRLWKKRWRKCGGKKMGLTFNEFLLAERRMKMLQKIPPSVINRRRKERHLQKEKAIRDKLEKRSKFKEDMSKKCFCSRVWHSIRHREVYGPETFGIRPSVIQFKFYLFNAIQGLIAFLLVLYCHLTNDFNLPPQFLLQGLYTLVYFANAMDFYGSIFGMVTSFHLETYTGRNVLPSNMPSRKKRKGCCRCCCKVEKKETSPNPRGDESVTATPTNSTHTINSKTLQNNESSLLEDKRMEKRKSKSRIKRMSASTTTRTEGSHRHHSRKHQNDNAVESGKAGHKEQDGYKSSSKPKKTTSKTSAKGGGKCKCTGLGFLYCCMIRKCFRPGRSREFINRMGYCSWILLQLAWFLNVFFSAYYNWVDIYYKDYKQTYAKCEVYPRAKLCDDFDWLFYFLSMVVGVTFVLRNIFLFIVGMCFSERHLRRCQSVDPNEELASTCSDTDIDYSKVPRPILVPHVISGGKYPYVLPGPCRPVDYLQLKIAHVTEKHRKAKLMAEGGPRKAKRLKNKRNKRRRRLLPTHEKEAAKMQAEFKQVRRARTVLEKGKRKPWRLPMPIGVTDEYQLPPDLMTAKAWAWLYDDDSSSEEDVEIERRHMLRQQRPVKWRRARRRKVEPIDSEIVTILHNPASKSRVPLEEVVKPKLENLSDRESTDASWSGDSNSLFETGSADDELDHRASDAYLELMSQWEQTQKERSKSEFNIADATRQRRSSARVRKSMSESTYK